MPGSLPARAFAQITPLAVAVHAGKLEAAKVLIAHGADATQVDASGLSAYERALLHLAVSTASRRQLKRKHAKGSVEPPSAHVSPRKHESGSVAGSLLPPAARPPLTSISSSRRIANAMIDHDPAFAEHNAKRGWDVIRRRVFAKRPLQVAPADSNQHAGDGTAHADVGASRRGAYVLLALPTG